MNNNINNNNNNNNTNDNDCFTIQGILFDLDGTLVDTESLSDKALMMSIDGLSDTICQQYNYRLPWELKQQILGLRGSEWAPIVLNYAATHWQVPIPTSTNNSDNEENLMSLIVTKLWKDWEMNLNKLCQEEVEECSGASALVHSIATHYPQIPMAIATSSRYDSYEKKRICIEQQLQQSQHSQHSIIENDDTNDTIDTSTRSLSMFQCMAAVVCGDHPNVINGKPAPDIYIEAAYQINRKPKYCIAFEDSLSGIRSAKAAGCSIIVAIPDNRYTTNEKQTLFQSEATLVLDSLWDLDGSIIGLPKINMPLLQLQKQINSKNSNSTTTTTTK